MTETARKASVKKLFWEQVALNVVVVAVLIAAGALLTFKVMGEDYGQWTIVGFFATVFFAFIAFLPAGTLFAARAEFAKDKVEVREDEKTGATAPITIPLLATAPLGVAFAAIGTAIAYALVYWGGWMPSPLVTTLASFLFVVPYAVIVWLHIFRDIEGLAAQGAFRAKAVKSKTRHIWLTYVIPNLVFQSIINLPLGYRGFSHAASLNSGKRGRHRAGRGARAGLRHHLHVRLQLHLPRGDGAHRVGHVRRRNVVCGQSAWNQRIPVLYPHPADGRGARDRVRSRPARRRRRDRLLRDGDGPEVPRRVPVRLSACRLGVGWMGKKFNDAVAHKMAAAH